MDNSSLNFSDLFNQTNQTNQTSQNNLLNDINEYGLIAFLIFTMLLYVLGFFQNKKIISQMKTQFRTIEQPIKSFENLIKSYIISDWIIKKKTDLIKKRRASWIGSNRDLWEINPIIENNLDKNASLSKIEIETPDKNNPN